MVEAKATFRATAVTIACTDIARTTRFYEEVLGAVLEPGDGYGCRWYKLGQMSLSIMPNASEPSPSRMPSHPMAMLWLETDNLAAAVSRFTEFGVRILQPSDGQFMMVSDPDGIIIEVWQSESARQ